jgi:hypothetical protein
LSPCLIARADSSSKSYVHLRRLKPSVSVRSFPRRIPSPTMSLATPTTRDRAYAKSVKRKLLLHLAQEQRTGLQRHRTSYPDGRLQGVEERRRRRCQCCVEVSAGALPPRRERGSSASALCKVDGCCRRSVVVSVNCYAGLPTANTARLAVLTADNLFHRS